MAVTTVRHCTRQAPWRATDRILRRFGWHCTDCWRAQREEWRDEQELLAREDADTGWHLSTDGMWDGRWPV